MGRGRGGRVRGGALHGAAGAVLLRPGDVHLPPHRLLRAHGGQVETIELKYTSDMRQFLRFTMLSERKVTKR